jgi:peroxiredoxin Q/BCP
MPTMLENGQVAPIFSLLDQDGTRHNLPDYHGQKVLLYFYPKDDTPGCTQEACAIAEVYDDFNTHGVKVFGVSADDPASHKAFALKYNLPFTLLSDPNFEAIKAYGAYEEEDASGLNIHSRRVSYLIDEEGKIEKVYPEVDPATHAHTILADLN